VPDVDRSSIGAALPGNPGPAAVTLRDAHFTLAWNLRGNPARSSFVSEAERLLGLALPLQPNTSTRVDETALLWLGPRSWLLLAATGSAWNGFEVTRKALNAAGGALFDVSASRIAYVVDGARAANVLAAGCPLDFDPRVFSAGQCRQSLYGRVPALFYRHGEPPACTVLVARSFARDVWHSLCTAAAPYGYTVRAAARFA
jgi:sarcosine oxidase, subunit gamma